MIQIHSNVDLEEEENGEDVKCQKRKTSPMEELRWD
jgi:hypothetical protein